MKFFTSILLIFLAFPATGQKLNESYLKARAAMTRNDYPEAGQQILSVPLQERSPDMYLTLGESYYLSGEYAQAVSALILADSLKASAEAELYLARSYAHLSQPDNSVKWLKKHLGHRDRLSESELQLDPALEKIERSKEWKDLWNSREWYVASERKAAEAASMIRRGKYTEALDIIDSEISKRSSSAQLYALRAKAYQGMEQYETAYESYREATRLRTNHPGYFSDAAELALRTKKYDMALENINKAIRLDPYRLDLYLQRASVLRMLKRYDDSRQDINFYFTYFPSDKKALYQMGMAETESGNVRTGIEYFSILIDQDKTSPDYFMARANAYMMVDNLETAVEDLSQALDINPKLPEAWYKKGIALQRSGDTDNACYYWRKALSLGSKEAAEYIYKYCTK